MTAERLLIALEEEFKKNGEEFKAFLWQDGLGKTLESQKRFVKLKNWVRRRIEIESLSFSINAPMKRTEEYTNGNFEDYLESIQSFGVLLHCLQLLEDRQTSEEQRKNIEYTLERLYGVKYDEMLEDYV